MADVNVDPDAVRNAVNVMNNNKESIITDLQGLLTAVTALLTLDGGLWLKNSSPIMSTEFQAFSRDLQEAITNIQSFAESFNSTVTNLQLLDDGYSKRT
ncbi:hypothetical protein [Kineosporia succinea]|uniref:Uncharacterized protein YukE n=1 Tax=Kineosporia succinea TaxID=84632 RepID=A0ABT9PE62_9ACTN|nr:hypothetical protein [Kineosporia succinea]MDP9830993.1 uncharacterized protein YukE [Kineosporia succinea]